MHFCIVAIGRVYTKKAHPADAIPIVARMCVPSRERKCERQIGCFYKERNQRSFWPIGVSRNLRFVTKSRALDRQHCYGENMSVDCLIQKWKTSTHRFHP